MFDVRRRLFFALLAVATTGLLVVGAVWRNTEGALRGQTMSIWDIDPLRAERPWPSKGLSSTPASGPPFLTSVSADGRYFVDQYSKPFLVRGDSPWALMTRVTPEEVEAFYDARQRQGVNVLIVSLLGARANGGPGNDGRTSDGLLPFHGRDILNWQEPYWDRVAEYLRLAADHGMTVLLYPIDGWTVGQSFVPTSVDQCRDYGALLAERLQGLPNIVWMSGGDYTPGDDSRMGSDVDRCIDATMRGIRSTGDARPFSMQLWYDKSVSTESGFWAPRVDWNFAYSYYPTYKAVLDAYRWSPSIPVLLGEANYEGENNQPDTPSTTDETIRRQVLWALTSGASGDVMGSSDWQFPSGWQQRLESPVRRQVSRIRRVVEGIPWWELAPEVDATLVTSDRGTRVTTDAPLDVLDNDYVTVARSPDGRYALVYVPTQRTVVVDRSRLAPGVCAEWFDPVTGAHRRADVTRPLSSPAARPDGTSDWLLVVRPEEA